MTEAEKRYIIKEIMELLFKLIDSDSSTQESDKKHQDKKSKQNKPVEMLTIKECLQTVQGVSERSIRMIVAQGKVRSVRTGEGRNGKILVNKDELLAYFSE